MKKVLMSVGIVMMMSGICSADMLPFDCARLYPSTISGLLPKTNIMSDTDFRYRPESYRDWIDFDLQVIEGVLQLEVMKWGASKINLCVLGENTNLLSMQLDKCFVSFNIDF